MTDLREQILARLTLVCAGVTGIAAAARNRLDVPGLYRPAAIVLDGAEQLLLDRPGGSNARFGQVQLMELSPEIRLLLRADDGDDAGAVTSLFRGRVVNAILSDASLRSVLGVNGAMRYEGCSMPEPSPDTKEPRLDINIVFTYPLRLSDIAA